MSPRFCACELIAGELIDATDFQRTRQEMKSTIRRDAMRLISAGKAVKP